MTWRGAVWLVVQVVAIPVVALAVAMFWELLRDGWDERRRRHPEEGEW